MPETRPTIREVLAWRDVWQRLVLLVRANWSWRQGLRIPECQQCGAVLIEERGTWCADCLENEDWKMTESAVAFREKMHAAPAMARADARRGVLAGQNPYLAALGTLSPCAGIPPVPHIGGAIGALLGPGSLAFLKQKS